MDDNNSNSSYDNYVYGQMLGGQQVNPENFPVPPSNPALFGMWLSNVGKTQQQMPDLSLSGSGGHEKGISRFWIKGNRLNFIMCIASILTFGACMTLGTPLLGPFLFIGLFFFLLCPLFVYAKALAAASEYGNAVKVRFGLRGSLLLSLTCMMVFFPMSIFSAWIATHLPFQGLETVNSVDLYFAPFTNLYFRSLRPFGITVLSITTVLSLPVTMYLHGWYARRVANGKKAMPWYVKTAIFIMMLPILRIFGLNLLVTIVQMLR